ncbi:unnamed protein product [Porites evermanni]|uniref:CTHRC1 C-terminal domain-containing protein n=1 Tax=Porites evermanni TaxID=104178 RepID=A0ABN8SCJ6_9CNID|nr:unnamed protein product [Porites evermanni]
MVQYFAVFLILSFFGGSLVTTTSPQQRNDSKLKDLCQRSLLGFPGIPGSNGIPGVPGVPGPHGPQGREGVKGQIGDKGSQGMPGPRGDRGREGPPGKSGPRGIQGMKGQQGLLGMKGERGAVGIKGERGIVGMKGEQGAKRRQGEKGESAKASQSSVVPQTNWKQCVWKSGISTDNGKIKNCAFNKLQSNSALRVSFQGNMRVEGTSSKCNRWYFKFNGNECSGPMTIDAVIYNYWPSGNPNLLHHRSLEGYCENIPQGAVRVELWVGKCSGYTLGDAHTGWNSVSRIMIEEVSRSQS